MWASRPACCSRGSHRVFQVHKRSVPSTSPAAGSSLQPGTTLRRAGSRTSVRSERLWRLHVTGPTNARDSPATQHRPLPSLGEQKEVSDNVFDLFMIAAFRLAMGRMASWQAEEAWFFGPKGSSYRGLVKIARRLFASSPETTVEKVTGVLRAFPTQPQLLRDNKFGYEALGLLTPVLFPFLVGECSLEQWEPEPGTSMRSKVVIERCRFLEASSCKGMCVGLCREPTEQFFNKELGLRMSMTPDFESGKCELIWGKDPQDLGESEDLRCYSECTTGTKAVFVLSAAEQPDCPLLTPWTPGDDYVAY